MSDHVTDTEMTWRDHYPCDGLHGFVLESYTYAETGVGTFVYRGKGGAKRVLERFVQVRRDAVRRW